MDMKRVIPGIVLSIALIGCGGGGKSSKPKPVASTSSLSSSSISSSSSSSSSYSSDAISAAMSAHIVVDQFGYLPEVKKVAVIRDPQTGFDAAQDFTPGETYNLVDADTGAVVHTGTASPWNAGATHDVSGDKVWWFDFSSVTAPGNYAVVDMQNNARSPRFKIAADVYRPVLKHALRTFYYQRAGSAKELPYADSGWTDAASHIGSLQDKNARLYSDPENATTERDLSGGWYDGDEYHRYTNRHADYVISLLQAYLENSGVWTDDFNLPESGNGIPDLLDEIKWGMDWLIKMQNQDGSLLSVLSVGQASPPSAAIGPSTYGPPNTSGTLTASGAFALGAYVFANSGNEALVAYADDLRTRAVSAWTWADANPNVVFQNNDAQSRELGGIQQEVNDAGRALKKHLASIYLFAATGEVVYREYFETNYNSSSFTAVTPWNEPQVSAYLFFALLPEATATVAATIKTRYATQMNASNNLPAVRNNTDAYRVPLGTGNFVYGSNRTVLRKAVTFYNLLQYQVGDVHAEEIHDASLGYLNYLHGTNPFGMVYLSNMGSLGAYSSVNEISHRWFMHGNAEWDRVGESNYGPPPGFLVVGPNRDFGIASCCPASCPFAGSNAVCSSVSLEPPLNQPPMKAYKDFNTGWPLNSWQVAENQSDLQIAYLRLLSKYVR